MATLTVKNIPDSLYLRLRKSAKANRRSLNSEIIVCMEQALEPGTPNTDLVLGRARELRAKTAAHRLTDRELGRAKRVGRP